MKSEQFMADWKKEVGDRPPGRFAHYCYDWDGMMIDEYCVEASSCHDVDYDDEAKACTVAAEIEFETMSREALEATLPATSYIECMQDPPEEE